MDCFPAEAQFKYPWRTYQARVLAELDEHLGDNRLHIVAAPGSGKTVLGLEVVRRLNRPALILAPTLTIRDQWVERFVNLFLPETEQRPDWISTDVREPGFVTVVTYQALHVACAGGTESEEAEEEAGNDRYAGDDDLREDAPVATGAAARLLREHRIGTIVVDEAHHLRSEWWRTLRGVCSAMSDATVVALTATPPYDVSPFEWERYRALCGPVDAEVPAPELVLAGDLCPHQDYTFFSTPSAEEAARIHAFRAEVERVVGALKQDVEFIGALQNHPWLAAPDASLERILDDPEYFSSIVIFLNSVGGRVPPQALRILGAADRELPPFDLEWCEVLLERCLYRYRGQFADQDALLQSTERELKRVGAIERRQVRLRSTERIRRILASSISKLNSMVEVVRLESAALGRDLRMVVLTDFIRAADLPGGPEDIKPLNRIGVVPIFERLRREGLDGPSLGALSGSLVIVPRRAQDKLVECAADMGIAAERINLTALPYDPDYLRLEIAGAEASVVVQLVTRLFSAGAITVLVGTKSLLGEGWDAPSVNTLVLASFVGSYMLSNQMRGRAIRTQADDPEKTANIWHLVCVEPDAAEPGDDLETLKRRFRAFMGPALDEPVIESGIGRLGIGAAPYSEVRVREINRWMIERAEDRAGLREAWREALQRGTQMRTAEELRAPVLSLPRGFVFANTIAALFWEGVFIGGYLALDVGEGLLDLGALPPKWYLTLASLAFLLCAVAAAPRMLKALWLLVKHGSIESSMRQVGGVVLRALTHVGAVRTPEHKLAVMAERGPTGEVYCALAGGTTYEKTVYLDALREVLDPIDNPRYLLSRKSVLWSIHRQDYHAVPGVIGARKEFAEFFAREWRRNVGAVELIYTRTVEGRKVLLKARTGAMSSAFRPASERVSCWR
ncbi:MAG: DEAD/DEAH box helicase family protein [Armatimonadota bacterium]|nr:MAG: DEAD/DEAH box helicase family protein [Armatimonadota bacterium]